MIKLGKARIIGGKCAGTKKVALVRLCLTISTGETGGDSQSVYIRDIEQGKVVKLSNIQAVAVALELELVEVERSGVAQAVDDRIS